MKTLLLAAAASLALTAAMSGAAKADVLTDWTVTKTKTTTITEPTTINKTETVTVTDTRPLNSEASGLAVINSSVTGAVVGTAHVTDPLIGTDSDPEIPDFVGDENNYDIHRSSTTTNSILRNTGIGEVNQDVGNNSNQGNVIAAGFVFGGNDLVKAEAYVEQLSTNNSSRNVEDGNPASLGNNLIPNPAYNTGNPSLTPDQGPLLPQITASMTGSMDGNTGVFFVNQNAGNNNQQHNALAAAIGDNAFTALADAGLHQLNSGNHVYDVNTVKQDTVNGSVNSNTGIVALNQSVGDNNNQATVINVASISSFVSLP
jgi:hypothetical protein